MSFSPSPVKWKEHHQRAILKGYAGSLDDYIELYNYVKRVIRDSNSGFDVSPTKVNGFQVEPAPPAIDKRTVSTQSTFHITPLSDHQMQSASNSAWLMDMRENIKNQVRNIAKVETPRFEALKRRERERDDLLRERRRVLQQQVGKVKLPSDAIPVVKSALQQDPETVLISKFGIDFTVKDLSTLKAGVWLNDEVINFYMQLIQERSNLAQRLPSVHVFSTFFYPKLIKSGYSAVRTSTRRITPSVLTRSLILIPIHLTAHWCMACIDMEARRISYYDSLGGSNQTCLAALKEWLMAESQDKLGVSFDMTGWVDECCHDIPHQQNGSDCGVFAIAFAEYLSRKASFTFDQRDMPQFRNQIAYEILKGSLLNAH